MSDTTSDDKRLNWSISSGEPSGPVSLHLAGPLTISNSSGLIQRIIQGLADTGSRPVVVDLVGVSYLDSAGALLLLDIRKRLAERGISFINGSAEAERIIALVGHLDIERQPLKTEVSQGVIAHAGEATLRMMYDAVQIISFLGELVSIMLRSVARPSMVRWDSVIFYMKRAGVDGLPIVGLISLLVGVVMAFMSALQLKQFGADIYVASLVGLAIVKELGPMMTAIIVAGRSGAAFSAEIGTMMVNMEVDALTTMGFNPLAFLAQPKVIAAMLVVPVLTVYSFIFGIGGGMLVGVLGLNLSVYTYLQQTLKAITAFDVVSSLVKSVVFAFLISAIGCQRGFQVRGGAEAVGALTTSAVVSAIFLVIVADSVFAVLLHYLGGGP